MELIEKYTFENDIAVDVQFLYDEPKLIETQYGESQVYTLLINGHKRKVFSTDYLHNEILAKGFKTNDIGTIIKIRTPEGKTKWDVRKKSTGVPATNGALKPVSNGHTNGATPDWDEIARGKVRHGVAIAFIGRDISVRLTDELKTEMESWVDYIMNGNQPINEHREIEVMTDNGEELPF